MKILKMAKRSNQLVMIVDDDSDDIEFFIEAIEKIGHDIKCMTAKNGSEALHMLNDTEDLPDFIFLDVNMPVMNGKECLKEIKHSNRLSPITVIMYSTSRNEEEVEETKNLGANGFMKKPVLFKEVCDKIKMIITAEEKDLQDLALY